MNYEQALVIAEKIKAELAPHCERIEIAGDIRGKRQEVKSIDIVAIPNTRTFGLLHDGIASVIEKWEKIEDSLYYNYTERILPSGIKLELHFAQSDNWGFVYAFRSGSAEYFYRVIATGWRYYGYELKGEHLYDDGEKIALHEEEDLFRLLKMSFEEPETRYI